MEKEKFETENFSINLISKKTPCYCNLLSINYKERYLLNNESKKKFLLICNETEFSLNMHQSSFQQIENPFKIQRRIIQNSNNIESRKKQKSVNTLLMNYNSSKVNIFEKNLSHNTSINNLTQEKNQSFNENNSLMTINQSSLNQKVNNSNHLDNIKIKDEHEKFIDSPHYPKKSSFLKGTVKQEKLVKTNESVANIEDLIPQFTIIFEKYERREIPILDLLNFIKKELIVYKSILVSNKITRDKIFESLSQKDTGRQSILNHIFKQILEESIKGNLMNENLKSPNIVINEFGKNTKNNDFSPKNYKFISKSPHLVIGNKNSKINLNLPTIK